MARNVHLFTEGSEGNPVNNANSGGKVAASLPTSGNMFIYTAAVGTKWGTADGGRRTLDAVSAYLRYDDPTPAGREGVRMPVEVPAGAVTGTNVLSQSRTSADALTCNLVLDSSKRIGVQPVGSGNIGLSATLAAGLYWAEYFTIPGTTTADGTAEVYVYGSDGTTLVHSATLSNVNVGTVPSARWRVGNPNTNIGLTAFDLTEIQWGTLASGTFGKYVVSTPPIADIVLSTPTIIVDARGSDAGMGGTLSYSITHASGPNNLGSVTEAIDGYFGIPMDTDGSSVYNITITESPSGLTTVAPVTVPVIGSNVIEELYWDGADWL